MSEKLTREQVQERFLERLDDIVEYAVTEPRWDTERKKIRGAIFAALSMIDGEAYTTPSFTLCPAPHEDDRAFYEARGEDYYPEKSERLDIAGDLHELWTRRG
jgi:hypothetical protein